MTGELAPHGFLRYWPSEVDSGILLYAPLRVTLHEDHDGRPWLSVAELAR